MNARRLEQTRQNRLSTQGGKVTVTHCQDIRSYTTKDGSTIRELMYPAVHGNSNLSLAEAKVPIGKPTKPHIHKYAERIYHVTEERGILRLGDQRFEVKKGDTVRMPFSWMACWSA